MESIESFLFEDGLEEAQRADVSLLLKNFNAQWRLAADARSASKQRVIFKSTNECPAKRKGKHSTGCLNIKWKK